MGGADDLERVAPCLPGAAITGHDEDGTYHGTFTVKLGPMTAAYNGTIRIEDADQASHTGDPQGQGHRQTRPGRRERHDRQPAERARRRHAGGGGDRLHITGRLAQFGRGGIMQDVSNRLMREFATCLSSRLAEPPRRHPRRRPAPR